VNYDLEQLNSIHQVVLETFEHKSKRARVVSPLFGLDKSNETHAIDSTIASWLEEGIRPGKIIMQLPTYALVQTFSNESTHHKLNDLTEDRFSLISQQTLCQKFSQNPSEYQQHMLYDMISAYSTSESQWLSYETNETITYKVKIAILEGLGGIGLSPINQDDFQNGCGRGMFPLLHSIHASICPKASN